MMESLKLQTELRNSLYFNKFVYRAQCRVQGAAYTYYTKSLDEFKRKMENRQKHNSTRVTILLGDWRYQVDNIDYEQIGKYFTWRDNADKDRYMCRIQGDHIGFFSDDLELLKTLDVLDPDLRLSKAEVIQGNVLYFKKDPKYKFRTFFKGKKAPNNFREDVTNFITSYDHIAKISPALKRYVADGPRRSYYNYLHSSYYVDYNDESTLTLLHMFFSSMIAKTYSLAKEP